MITKVYDTKSELNCDLRRAEDNGIKVLETREEEYVENCGQGCGEHKYPAKRWVASFERFIPKIPPSQLKPGWKEREIQRCQEEIAELDLALMENPKSGRLQHARDRAESLKVCFTGERRITDGRLFRLQPISCIAGEHHRRGNDEEGHPPDNVPLPL